MKKLLIALWVACFALPVAAFGQTGTLAGVVSDAAGEALPGATVYIPNVNLGTTTDLNGRYSIANVPSGQQTVRFTFVGFQEAERTVNIIANQTTTLDVNLETALLGLDELVVVGYGVQRRREEAAAMSTIRGDEIQRLPVQSADAAMQGRAAGVQITRASGAPGGGIHIRVRGTGSITAGNEPLYIIDGVQVPSGGVSGQGSSNALNSLNPTDIESIEILKDAAAASIYGAQAANGVVLITTRRGVTGATRFELNTSLGSTNRITTYDMLDASEWIEYMVDTYEMRARYQGTDPSGWRQTVIDAYGDPATVTDTDWQDAVYRTGQVRRVNLSARGGTDATRFYMSGGYENTDGMVIMSNFQRLTFLTNIDHRANDRVNIQANLRVASTEQFGTIEDGNFVNGPFHGAVTMRRTYPIYNEDGTYFVVPAGGYNIIQGMRMEDRIGRTRQFGGNLAANIRLMDNLVWRSLGGVDFRSTRDTNYRPREIPAFAGTGGSGREDNRERLNYNVNTTLSYFNTFGGVHNLNSVAGFEYKAEEEEEFWASAREFPSLLFRTLNTAATPAGAGGHQTEYRMAGFFGQARYDMDERYFVTGSIRYDGSSRFGEDRRWGLFYSGALAWDMAREAFMQNVGALDEMKWRISYGVTGNSRIGNFASRSLFQSAGTYLGQPALRPTQLGNNLLTWEEAVTINAGLDFSVLNRRISGSVDVFQRRNNELLLNRPLPTDGGFSSISQNVGVVQNRGLEFELSTINLETGGFRWSSNFNITFLNNEVIELADDQESIGTSIRVGHPLSVYYMPRYAGVNPADGRPMWYDADDNITYSPIAADNVVAGQTVPDYFGGFNNSFSYGPLALDVFFQYNIGQHTFNQTQGYFLMDPSRANTLLRDVERSWRQPGDITDVPLPWPSQVIDAGTAWAAVASTRWIEDTSYIRLKNVALSYRLPGTMAQRIGLQGLTLSVQGENLITWTGYTGIDPELVTTQAAIYPQSRNYTMGLQVQF